LDYYDKKEYEKSVKVLDKLNITIENASDVALQFRSIAFRYSEQGQIISAIALFDKAYKTSEIVQNEAEMAAALNSAADMYRLTADIENTELFAKRSLKIREKIGNQEETAFSLSTLAWVVEQRQGFQTAIEIQRKVLNIRKASSSVDTKAYGVEQYYRLINLYCLLKQWEIAKLTFVEMEEYFEAIDETALVSLVLYPLIEQLVLLSQGLLLKHQPSFTTKAKAQQILRQIVNGDIIYFELTITASLNLLDLLLEEYRTFEQKDVFKEITQIIEDLEKTSHNQHMYNVWVKIITIKSQLEFSSGHIDKAFELITNALWELKGAQLHLLESELTKVQDELNSKISNMIELINSNQPLIERIKFAGFEEYIGQALNLERKID